MPEIKNAFIKGKMNKDLDERLIPNGQYRDALNIEVSTSDNNDVGTVQAVRGNSKVSGTDSVPANSSVVGEITDEKNNCIYYFVSGPEANVSTFYTVPEPTSKISALASIVAKLPGLIADFVVMTVNLVKIKKALKR